MNVRTPPPGSAATVSYRGAVLADWLDANGHMNVSFYDRVFDAAEKTFFEEFAIDDAYIAATSFSFFRLEKLIRYERELLDGAQLEVRSRVAWTDFRVVHHFHELWNVTDGFRAASVDGVSIHVDLKQRRSTPIADPAVRLPLARLAEEAAALQPPQGLVRRLRGRRHA